jgi:hypothetical protein
MSDQCALDASGSLLDAKDIVFYESESDTCPIPKPIASQGSQLNVPTPVEGEYLTVLSARFTHLTCDLKGRGCHPKNTTKLKDSLIAQKSNNDGQLPKSRPQNSHGNKSRKAKKAKLIHENHSLSDDQDLDAAYTEAEVSDGSDSLTDSDEDSDEDAIVITNEEVRNFKQ